jgi:hypothetical protein
MGQISNNAITPITILSGSLNESVSGSISTHFPVSSIPSYPATGTPWRYQMLSTAFTTTLTAQQTITGLQITLINSRRYLIYGNLLVSTIRSANGPRVGVTSANTTLNIYNIENPTSTTAVQLGLNVTATAASGPGNSLTDYFYVPIRALVATAATGVPTWAPTLSSEAAAGGATDVGIGPYSHIYYREY